MRTIATEKMGLYMIQSGYMGLLYCPYILERGNVIMGANVELSNAEGNRGENGGLALRTRLAIHAAKLAGWWLRKWKKGGGAALPGYVARLVEPEILTHLAQAVRRQGKPIFVVMGTNGKTTTNSILCCILETEGSRVVINRTGANMLNGVLSALALAFDRRGCLKGDYVCLEVDENASAGILPLLQPDCVILTNLFRDQLDRFGEVELILEKVQNAIAAAPRAKLVVDCDDALLCSLLPRCENPVVTYGINQPVFAASARSDVREGCFCPFCGKRLEYDFFHYGQLGIWKCTGCGFARPSPDYTASEIQLQKGVWSFCLGNMRIHSKARAPYNICNTLAAYGAIRALKIPAPHLKEALEGFDYGNKRENRFCIGRMRIQLHLAKNPVGFQQKISLLLGEPGPKDLLIQINDAWQDGRDVSWLWDVDFRHLAGDGSGLASITVCGSRRYDMALRLKYENIPCRIAESLEQAVRQALRCGSENLYIIVNYSGLHQANRLLQELAEEGRGKEKPQKNESKKRSLEKGELLS